MTTSSVMCVPFTGGVLTVGALPLDEVPPVFDCWGRWSFGATLTSVLVVKRSTFPLDLGSIETEEVYSVELLAIFILYKMMLEVTHQS
jgi:hypothetical protein